MNALIAAVLLGLPAASPAAARVESGLVTLRFALPRQAVSLVTIEWR